MLVIRLQRTGRKGSAQFRIVIQDRRRTPKSGKVVQLLGNYDPHTKQLKVNKEKAEQYLKNGAQPSKRIIVLFKDAKISMPKWVNSTKSTKKKSIKNPDKRRSTAPAEIKEIKSDSITPEISTETNINEDNPLEENLESLKEETPEEVVKKQESSKKPK